MPQEEEVVVCYPPRFCNLSPDSCASQEDRDCAAAPPNVVVAAAVAADTPDARTVSKRSTRSRFGEIPTNEEPKHRAHLRCNRQVTSHPR